MVCDSESRSCDEVEEVVFVVVQAAQRNKKSPSLPSASPGGACEL